MIHDHRLDLFPTLMEQFASIVHAHDIEMSAKNFIDFIETMNKYLKYIGSVLDEPECIRAMLRMWGILPLNVKTLPYDEREVRLLTVALLQRLSLNLSSLFLNMDQTEWPLLKDGLVLLIRIEILSSSIHSEFDSMNLFSRFGSARKQQQEIAELLLQQLLELRQPIQRPNWITLLSFLSDNKLTCDYLKLSSTFDTFFLCSISILQRSSDDIAVQTRIKDIFDQMITQNIFRGKCIDYYYCLL